MHERRYRSGGTIFRAGEPSDTVYLVRSGSVALGEAGETATAGDIFGTEGVLTGGTRPDGARAVDEVSLLALERAEALSRLEADDEAFRVLFAALIRDLEEPAADAAETAEVNGQVNGAAEDPPAEPFRIRIAPASEIVAETVGNEHHVRRLPFVVGRHEDGSAPGQMPPDLALPSRPPYWVSRCHFAIELHGDELVIRDCGSFHGTIVNGKRIGGGSNNAMAPLGHGANEVIAGSVRSPFRFSVTLEIAGEG